MLLQSIAPPTKMIRFPSTAAAGARMALGIGAPLLHVSWATSELCATATDAKLSDNSNTTTNRIVVFIIPPGKTSSSISFVTAGDVSCRERSTNHCVTVKAAELMPVPPAVWMPTTPVLAPVGTVAVTCESEFTAKFAGT